MWQVMKRIGLHDFVNDMIAYKAIAGHFPDDMRQVREALTPSEHGSASQHVVFDQIFGQDNLRWGTLITLTHEPAWDGTLHSTDMYYEVHLTLSGPYGNCEVNARSGQYGTDPSAAPFNPFAPERPSLVAYPPPQDAWDSDLPGALPYTWQDECLLNTADGSISPTYGPVTEGVGGLYADVEDVPAAELLFPYLDKAAQHQGDFTLSARFVCVAPDPSDDAGEANEGDPLEQESCGNGGFALEVYNGLVKGLDDKIIPNSYGPAGPDNRLRLANAWRILRIELQYNPSQDTPLVRWSANGTCKILITGDNCSTAEIAR
jgi:hypothetical protein